MSSFNRESELPDAAVIDRSSNKVRDLDKSDETDFHVDRIACNSNLTRISIQVKVEENNNPNNVSSLINSKSSSKSSCNESTLPCNWCPPNGTSSDDQSLANMCVYRCHLTNDGRILCDGNNNGKPSEARGDVYNKTQYDNNFNHFRQIHSERYYQQTNLAPRLPQNYPNFDFTSLTDQEQFLSPSKISNRSIGNLGYSVDSLSSSIHQSQTRSFSESAASSNDKSLYSKSK